MGKRRFLIVDDNLMKSESEEIQRKAKQQKGLDLEFMEQLLLDNDEFLNEKKHFDKDKIKGKIEKTYSQVPIELIAVDFELEDEGGMNGLDIIGILRRYFTDSTFLIYSSDLDSVVKSIKANLTDGDSLNSADNRIKLLAKSQISNFVKRERLESEIIKQFENRKPTLKEQLLTEIERLPQVIFQLDFLVNRGRIKKVGKVSKEDLIGWIQADEQKGIEICAEIITRSLHTFADLFGNE